MPLLYDAVQRVHPTALAGSLVFLLTSLLWPLYLEGYLGDSSWFVALPFLIWNTLMLIGALTGTIVWVREGPEGRGDELAHRLFYVGGVEVPFSENIPARICELPSPK